MRKIFSILLIFVLAASFSACGSAPTPKDTAEKFLTAVKAKDAEGIRTVYDGSYSEDELTGTVESLLGDSEEGEVDDATKQFEEKLFDFDYTIGEERVDGENAEVDVTFKTYDFGTMLGQTRILTEELTNLTEKSYEKTVPMKLTKVEGDWKVAKIEGDSEFLNGMFGGMIDIVKEFEKFGDSLSVE